MIIIIMKSGMITRLEVPPGHIREAGEKTSRKVVIITK